MCREESRQFFCRGIFLIFFECLFQIWERAQKLGHIMFLRETLLLRDDPITHLMPLTTGPKREGRQQRYRPDLNQDLSNFWSRSERAESNWDLDSRNVRYGI